MNLLKNAWSYAPFRWGAIIAGLTAATLLLLPGLHIGGYSANRFLPHATCYLRDPGLIWLNVISDSFIAVAYLTISATLGFIVFKARHDIPFHWMFGAFGLFIVTCGFTHVMSVITVWRPYYWLAGDVKAVTAVASVATAVVLPITVPRVFSMIREAKVSEQRKQELIAAHERLKESDELKSQFFANVSHELRTPLTLILGPIKRQLADETLGEAERRELEVVERNAGLLLHQVNNLLDLAKIDAQSMQPRYSAVDLAEVTRLVGSYFEVLADEQQISYRLAAPDTLPAEADRDKVERVIMNLLSNAFKFTPAGGAVSCTISQEEETVVLVVEDSGPGIPEDLRDAVLDRFRQIDGGPNRRVGGTGLGLAIVKEFVAMHGGTLDIGSAETGGARLEVRLPRLAPAGIQVSASPGEADLEVGRSALDQLRSYRAAPATTPAEQAEDQPLVLVVEDNPDMNAFVSEILGVRYRVATAFDGQEGLQQAQRLQPDVVVTDLMMPHMSGDNMVSTLRADPRFAETPIVVLTARADEQQRVHLLETAVQDHLTKPFAPEELLARVDSLVRQRKNAIEKLRALNASLERRVADRTAQVEEQTEQLRLLAEDLSSTEQRERRRLAQMLHDHLQQLLVSAKMGLEQSALASDGSALLARVAATLDEALAASRSITLELYPPVLYDRGLAAALEWQARHFNDRYPLEITVDADPEAQPADQDRQAFLFSAIREFLLNVVKHANATRAHVTLARAGDDVVITVEDDGVGCDVDVATRNSSSSGFGLFNIRERLRVTGGSLRVDESDAGGCRILLRCPIEKP